MSKQLKLAYSTSEAYSKPCQTSKVEFFEKESHHLKAVNFSL